MKIIGLIAINAFLIAILPSSIGTMDAESEQREAWAQFYEDTKDVQGNGSNNDHHRLRGVRRLPVGDTSVEPGGARSGAGRHGSGGRADDRGC